MLLLLMKPDKMSLCPAVTCFMAIILLATFSTSPVVAQVPVTISVPPGPLDAALLTISSQAGTDILFDADLTKGLKTSGINGRYAPEIALRNLLQGTGLTLRRNASGTFVIERPEAAPLARQDIPAPEILVIGRRSQNADIRRMEADIQSYRVVTGRQIIQSDRDNLGQYFQSRVSANATAVMPSLESYAETRSKIELRGLDSDQTLILIDGRRMPRTPLPYVGFWQPDLNALPLNAIERVEVLTGTAGGIYGFGALGGVVNTVIASDRRGGELHFKSGLSARGDAFAFSIEGGLAGTLGERTQVRVFAAHSRAEPLLNRDRDYLSSDARLIARNRAGSASLAGSSGHAVEFRNGLDAPLQLKAEYGGTTLPARSTFIDVGEPLARDGIVASLTRNSGQVIDAPPPRDLDSWIGSAGRSNSLLANVRHRFDNGFEAYFDAVLLRSEGRAEGAGELRQGLRYGADDPANPFTSDVDVNFPIDAARLSRRLSVSADRYTAGLIAPLPAGWRANAEISLGSAGLSYVTTHVYAYLKIGQISPLPNPLGEWEQFKADIAPALTHDVYSGSISSRYRDLSLRLAGPLFKTAAGHATLALLAERRIESIPAYLLRETIDDVVIPISAPSYQNATTSYSAELNAPMVNDDAPWLLRGLKVQLAVRNDREIDDFSRDPASAMSERLQATFPATAYTIGIKTTPTRWLLLRASYAVGSTPPLVRDLIEEHVDFSQIYDPKRGGTEVIAGRDFLYVRGGFPDLGLVKASTLSFGGTFAPFGPEGPRFTLDYSRIRKSGDVVLFFAEDILAHEEKWPDRVLRAPLTASDRALGYTGGAITSIDARAANAGSLTVETLDARLDWRLPVGAGSFRLYGDVTYYIEQLLTSPILGPVDLVGYIRRPLRWRGNAGADWSQGPVTIGLNIQHFDSYRILWESPSSLDPSRELAQGGPRIRAQTYVDVHVGWSLRHMKVDFGIVNVFDTSPARETREAVPAVESVGYSRFGDPRRRRFVLNLSSTF